MSDNTRDFTPINKELADDVRKHLPDTNDIMDLADFFKVMGDNTRLKILIALLSNELCVSDLSYLLSMSQSAISHQLKALKRAKLIKSRRDGRMMYYSLDDDHIKCILDDSMAHILDEER